MTSGQVEAIAKLLKGKIMRVVTASGTVHVGKAHINDADLLIVGHTFIAPSKIETIEEQAP